MSHLENVEHSSARQDWRTPDWLVLLVDEGLGGDRGIDLDPCASDDSDDWFALVNVARDSDGLAMASTWAEMVAASVPTSVPALAFVNSEYGRALPAWVKKCADESGPLLQVVQLTPNRPGSAWYRAAMRAASAMCSLDGRLTFKGAPAAAPFPSALFYYGVRPYRFADVFQDHGDVRVMQ